MEEDKKQKYMDIGEFREGGYLQELNRTFLHPLGLALEITIDKDGEEVISGVWDSRDDDEGMVYDLKGSDNERIKRFKSRQSKISLEKKDRGKIRKELLGFNIEPIAN